MTLLKARSKLGEFKYTMPNPPLPQRGHQSARLALGLGEEKGRSFTQIKIRPDYHDILDPDIGYIRGAAISFFDGEFRYHHDDHRFVTEKLILIDIASIGGRTELFSPVSWKVRTGWIREDTGERDSRLIYSLNTGGGLAFNFFSFGIVYALLEPEIKAGGQLKDRYSIGGGFSFGGLLSWKNWKIHLNGKRAYFELGDQHRFSQLSLNQSFQLSQNNALKLEIGRKEIGDYGANEVSLNWNLYF